MNYFVLITTVFLLILSMLFFLYALVSHSEKQPIAVKKSLVLGVLFLLITISAIVFYQYIPLIFYQLLLSLMLVVVLVFFLPIKRVKLQENTNKPLKFDERRTMFSRAELEKGSQKFDDYYSIYPEDKEKDDFWRTRNGLLSEKSQFFDKAYFASANSSFEIIGHLSDLVEGETATVRTKITSDAMKKMLYDEARQLGALNIGFTELQDHHVYSVKGRGERYGEKLHNKHPNAIAFTVEMDHKVMSHAPKAPVIAESARRYLHSGMIAIHLAKILRELGYNARAHIDGNYELICPLVAESAGLGRIGRMGLLMTPKQGPRVRLAVITTDFPFELDEVKQDLTVDEFCRVCKKCVKTCPSQAIPDGEKMLIDGVERWKINSERCFSYWCLCGTDCGRCMAVCPYAHPDNFLHNFIRWGIRNNFLFRKIAVPMDDFFYGKKPKIIDNQ